jgi:sugar phosphate isomerase/epimerase
MKLGLHAYTLQLAGGLREFQPVGRGSMTAEALLEKAAKYHFTIVQFARQQVQGLDMVTLAQLRGKAEALGITLLLSTSTFTGEHLVEMIHLAQYLGAPLVSVGISHLQGNVQVRQARLEGLLADLEPALRRAKRAKVKLAIENGRHTAAVDLAAFLQAAESDVIGACVDVGNPLTVPEDPVESARLLAPYCLSIHLKDWQVYRDADGAVLVNCPVGEGVLELTAILRELKVGKAAETMPLLLQTVAERFSVPVLRDAFLQQYPRISARALAALLRRGTLIYAPESLDFPHERRRPEREVLKWEEDRLNSSLKQVQKLLGTESLTLSL